MEHHSVRAIEVLGRNEPRCIGNESGLFPTNAPGILGVTSKFQGHFVWEEILQGI
jgi:hypothetical protein